MAERQRVVPYPGEAGAADAVQAFSREAAGYDRSFGTTPAGLLFRHVVRQRLQRLFAPGSRVLDLGCGTGEDALALAAAGVFVHGIDAAPAMIERARAKAATSGLEPARLRFEVQRAEDAGRLPGLFEGAYSNFGALNCADLPAVGAALARVLRPGSPVLVSLMGRWPLPATLHHAATRRGEPRRHSRPRVAGVRVETAYLTLRQIRRALGPGLAWRRAFALGVLVPGPDHGAWAGRHPLLFGALAAVEGVVRGWPLLRGLGDHVVLEGVRR